MKKLILLILIIFSSCKKDFDEYEFINIIILHTNETINYSFLSYYVSEGNLKNDLKDTSYIERIKKFLFNFSMGYDIIEDEIIKSNEANQNPEKIYQFHEITIKSKKSDKRFTFEFKEVISKNCEKWKLDWIVFGRKGLDE